MLRRLAAKESNRFVVIPVSLAASWLLAIGFKPFLHNQAQVLPFTLAVLASSYYGGLWSGLIATGLGFVIADYFFTEPLHKLLSVYPEDFAALAAFLIFGISTSFLSHLRMKATRALQVTNQRLEVLNRELVQAKRTEEELQRSREKLAISERSRMQEKLLQTEATVRTLLETAVQGILAIDVHGSVVIANRAAEEMFGYGRNELLGRPLEILLPDHLRERHAMNRETFLTHLEPRPMGLGFDLQGLRRDGTHFPVEIGLNGLETAEGKLAVAFINDITERKRTEEALRQREQEVSTLLDGTPDVILRLDRQFRFTYVNAKTASVAGIPREAFIGKTSAELGLPQDLIDLWMIRTRQTFETGQPDTLEFSYPSPGGPTDWEERFIPESAPDGSVESVLVIGRDVTERKRLERIAETNRQEIRALSASLLTAQEEERRRVSRELHDQICQQLASLAFDIGGLVADPPGPEDARVRLKALQARVVKASDETRHIAYQLHPSMLDDLGVVASLRSLCKEFSERAPDIELTFTGDAVPGTSVPREVTSCVYRIAQESLQNIAKHAHAKHVSVVFTLQGRAITLTIADDGAGFDLEAIRGRGGSGLIGMEERARLVNGKLTIASRPGHGARIALEVPLDVASV